MSQKRFGIFIPPYGYVYNGETYSDLHFTPDPTKAALGKSFTKEESAVEFISRLNRRKPEYKDAQVAVFDIKASVTHRDAVNAKEKVQEQRRQDYRDELEKYLGLKSKYDAMDAKALDKEVSDKAWRHFKQLERTLLALELI